MSDEVKQALSDALTDENNLRPTHAAVGVIADAALATEQLDQHWSHAGAPSAVDYAAAVVKMMEKRYLGCRR